MKLNRLDSEINRTNRAKLNENMSIIESDFLNMNINVKGYKETVEENSRLVNQANLNASKAIILANAVQDELDSIVVEGDSSVEAAQARTNTITGETYVNLRSRLDKENNEVNQLLTQAIDDFRKEIIDTGINIKHPPFNAKGDGIEDTHQILVHAISYANLNGGHIIIPDGLFLFKTDTAIDVPSNIKMFCYGELTFLRTRTKSLFNVLQAENVLFSGFKIDGQALPADDFSDTCLAIMIRSCKNVEVVGGDFKNITGDAVYVGRNYTLSDAIPSEDIRVNGNRMHNIKRNSFAVVNGRNIEFKNNYVTSDVDGLYNRSAVIDVEPNRTNDILENIYIDDNYVAATAGVEGRDSIIRSLCGSGKEPTNYKNIFIRRNTVVCLTNTRYAIVHDGAYTAINSNIVGNVIQGSCEVGIQAYHCYHDLNIVGNSIENSSVTGIYSTYSTDNAKGISINDNSINISNGRAIYLIGNKAENIDISSNKITGITTANETIFVNGNSFNNKNINISNNKDGITGTANGIRLFQCEKARIVANDTEKITTTTSTNIARSLNTINGQFPRQRGTTAERPSSVDDNHIYFDTTLNKPIIYSGGWKDFTGGSV